ncbi:hypothetical protein PAHAL_4G334300 [Panicum hallii]|uniref:Uncharacterized protein n=1 Tax=Panicum hallii TaxID=206008 RepID=A0A2T8JEW1_9POAL|nr:hypothetical protein PAHAL_4G334300 [Panicum hallii]
MFHEHPAATVRWLLERPQPSTSESILVRPRWTWSCPVSAATPAAVGRHSSPRLAGKETATYGAGASA